MDYPVKTPLQLRPLLVGFRKAAGLTQAQMASHLGVTQQTYAQLEAKPESASMDRLFHVLKVLKVDIVLTHVSGSANLEGRLPGRLRTVESPVAVKQRVTKERATTAAAKTAGTRKAAPTPARGSRQGSPKPVTRKRVAPLAAAPKKREDW
ncbi:helix-turn-helix transcriptional regulator [Paraburkholderia lacunae]|uniref:Transcriptional regulator n=1 Tax=Paraburkholderia lacunae TaxID=2211104 RepID=A0A370MXK5_9BURK|nr:helix-turn-helix transcriptional regulator [Paraburkholderia lacunae]RDJ98074.1 transcriptional regulator [Paraburkholderia lacunae]